MFPANLNHNHLFATLLVHIGIRKGVEIPDHPLLSIPNRTRLCTFVFCLVDTVRIPLAMTTATSSMASTDQATDLAKQYDTPLGMAHSTMQALKDRIKLHYDLASDYYLSLWCVHSKHHTLSASAIKSL